MLRKNIFSIAVKLFVSPSPTNVVYCKFLVDILRWKILTVQFLSIAGAEPLWLTMHTCDLLKLAYLSGSVYFLFSLNVYLLQYLLITLISKTFPVSVDNKATAPFNDTWLFCQVPSHDTDVSVISVGAACLISLHASIMASVATDFTATFSDLTFLSCTVVWTGGGQFIRARKIALPFKPTPILCME